MSSLENSNGGPHPKHMGAAAQISSMRTVGAVLLVFVLVGILVWGVTTTWDFKEGTVDELSLGAITVILIWVFIELPFALGVKARRLNTLFAYLASIIRSIIVGLFGAYFFFGTIVLFAILQDLPVKLGIESIQDLNPFGMVALIAVVHSLFWTIVAWFDKSAAKSADA